MLTFLIVMLLTIKLVFRIERAFNKKLLERYQQLKLAQPEDEPAAEKNKEGTATGTAKELPNELTRLQNKTANRGCTIFIVGFFLSWFAGYWAAQSMNCFFPAELVQVSSAGLTPLGSPGEKNKSYFLGVGKVSASKFYLYISEDSETGVCKPAVTLYGERVTVYEQNRKSGRVLIYAKRPPSGAFLFSIPGPIPPEEEKQYEFQIPKGSEKELFTIE